MTKERLQKEITDMGMALIMGGMTDNSIMANFGDLYTLLTEIYECNGGKVVMDSAFARADYDFILKWGQEVWIDLGENVAHQNR